MVPLEFVQVGCVIETTGNGIGFTVTTTATGSTHTPDVGVNV